jgi:hypothetical protein
MNYGPLVICVDYDKRLLNRNMSVVVFVISKHDNKVKHVSVVEREALATWYTQKQRDFNPDFHTYIISTTSIVGEVVALLPDNTTEYKPPTTTSVN